MATHEKSEKSFNFIDVLIILAVIAIALTVVFRAQIITFLRDGERRSECVIEFQSEAVPKESMGYIKEGIALSWIEHGLELGLLGEINSKSTTVYVPQSDGRYMPTLDPSSYTITGSFKADVLIDNGCYIGGSAFLAPGMTITVHSENVQFEVTVLKINY